jgi:hypothetical protein
MVADLDQAFSCVGHLNTDINLPTVKGGNLGYGAVIK